MARNEDLSTKSKQIKEVGREKVVAAWQLSINWWGKNGLEVVEELQGTTQELAKLKRLKPWKFQIWSYLLKLAQNCRQWM